jgi:sulfide:quinone oxidoreductase
MLPKPVNATLSVSPQITPESISELSAGGFKSIICNRPDGDGADQTAFAEIEAAAASVVLCPKSWEPPRPPVAIWAT